MDISLNQIVNKLDVPLKSYWLFVYGKLRTGVWEELFKQHLDKYYPENPEAVIIPLDYGVTELTRGNFYTIPEGVLKGTYRALVDIKLDLAKDCTQSKRKDLICNDITVLKEVSAIRNSKRTNLPRTIWQKEELSWFSYYEGIIILSQVYKSITVELELAYKGSEIHKYSIPVSWDIFETPDGSNIKHSGRVDNSLVITPTLDRTNEQGLTYVIREIMRRHKLTRKGLDELLEVYVSDPDNLHTFTTNSKPNIKSSIIGTMFKWNITWGNFTRALKVLGYTDLSLNIHAVRTSRTGDEDVITTVNMGLV